MTDDVDILLTLPTTLRDQLKEPLGPIEQDIEEVLSDAGDTLIAVGDVVSYDCERVGRSPDVAVIDGQTKRTDVERTIKETLASADVKRLEVKNPAATITASLLAGLTEALERTESVQLVVDGEEDLAALPAVLAAPAGASVLYGQPDEGVVHVRVDSDTRRRARGLLEGMEGDHDRVFTALDA